MTDSVLLRACYAVTGFAAWLALRVLGLRRSVVRDNLRRSFPDWTPERSRGVEREFARRQGEIAAEVLYTSRIGADELRERVTIVNPEVLAGDGQPRPMMPSSLPAPVPRTLCPPTCHRTQCPMRPGGP